MWFFLLRSVFKRVFIRIVYKGILSLPLSSSMDLLFFHELTGVWLLGARSGSAFEPLFWQRMSG